MAGALSLVLTPKQLETAKAKWLKRWKERKSAAIKAGLKVSPRVYVRRVG